MQKIESKIGTIHQTEEKIYNYLKDFKNFEHLVPQDQINNWYAENEKCSFEVPMLGDVKMEIVEKEPYKLIKIGGEGKNGSIQFRFWIQLKETEPSITKVKLTIQPEMNPIMEQMAKKPLQKYINMLIDKIEGFSFES
jgi:carbon monoxide dehydrogenase subunit G